MARDSLSRRSFLAACSAAPALGSGGAALRIGVTEWQLDKSLTVDSLSMAKRVGFDGVELAVGRQAVNGRLPLDSEALEAAYLAEAKKLKIAIAGISLNILQVNFLKSDPLGPKWLADGIKVARRLRAHTVLVPFFGAANMKTRQEQDRVGDVLKELGPEAQSAGITLGLEDMLSAEDTIRIADRSKSSAVKVYYDVYNSTNYGYDAVKEILWLGKQRICQFHFKEDRTHYLGSGRIDYAAVLKAIADIGFRGWANLETESPSKSIENDMARNLGYIRSLNGKVPGLRMNARHRRGHRGESVPWEPPRLFAPVDRDQPTRVYDDGNPESRV